MTESISAVGGTGNDILADTLGRDIIVGSSGSGEDILSGNSGNDLPIGGGGIESFIVDANEIDTVIEGYAAGETVDLTAFADVANFGITGDGIDSTIAFSNCEFLTLTKIRAAELNSSDFVFAAPGATLICENGKEMLIGGAGKDTIIRNGGVDVLQGNGGNDIFVYAGSPSGQDTVSGSYGCNRAEGGGGDDTISLRTHTYVNTVEETDLGAGDNKIVGRTGENIFDFSGTMFLNDGSIDGGGWTDAGTALTNAQGCSAYENTTDSVSLFVDSDVGVTVA